jgi:uncharacterized protein DUF6062
MSQGHSHFELLDELKKPGCPVCALVIKDSRRYLDHLMYESVLDVSMRMELTKSFGFCNWHTWQLPSLPEICSPGTGYSIFAFDLLRRFDHLARALRDEAPKKRTLKSFLGKARQKLFGRIKERTCPACRHVAQFQEYHLNELADAVQDQEFLDDYKASRGICLPHFFLLQENFSTHPSFPLLLDLQIAKSRSLRDALEEFSRKQDYRFRDEINAEESRAWKVALEFITGKRGVFPNEMGNDLLKRSRNKTYDVNLQALTQSDKLTLGELADEIKKAKETVFYVRQSLPMDLFDLLNEIAAPDRRDTIEIVVEDPADLAQLRKLYSAGFPLFYGFGLPPKPIVFLGADRAFFLETGQRNQRSSLRLLKEPREIYYRLLWRRFGSAILLRGSIKETDLKKDLFSLAVENEKELWCRIKGPEARGLLEPAAIVEVFAWERWGSQMLQVIEVKRTR